jgi:hypothetical protein
MFRTAVLRKTGLYPYIYPHAEDYAFFWKMLQVTKGAVLGEYLTECAIMEQGISLSNRQAQLQSRLRVVRDFGRSVLLKGLGFIKLYLFLITPKTLLLRLKTGKVPKK